MTIFENTVCTAKCSLLSCHRHTSHFPEEFHGHASFSNLSRGCTSFKPSLAVVIPHHSEHHVVYEA